MSGGQGSLSISRLPFSPFTGPGPGYPEAEPQADTVTAGVSDRRQLLLEVPIERRPGNPQRLANFPDGVALVLGKRPQLLDLLRSQHLRSAKQPATRSSCLEPCVGALPDEVPLELGQCAEDVEDQFPTAGGGVDLFLEGAEANAPLLQLPDSLDQMRQRAAEPVQPPVRRQGRGKVRNERLDLPRR